MEVAIGFYWNPTIGFKAQAIHLALDFLPADIIT